MSTQPKQGKDWRDYTEKQARALLKSEGFVQERSRTQQYTHRTLYHFVHSVTGQRASISVELKTGTAKVAYHHLTKTKRRTAEQIRRDNYVQYD